MVRGTYLLKVPMVNNLASPERLGQLLTSIKKMFAQASECAGWMMTHIITVFHP